MPELPTDRRDALAAFYTRYHHRLYRAVRARVLGVDDSVIADACGYAWLQLVRRPDVGLDGRGLNWLKIAATQQAWRLADLSREQPAGSLIGDAELGELGEPHGDADDPLALVIAHQEHQRHIEHFAHLKPRQRRELLLQAAGYRYQEIGQLTRASYTAVNRWLAEGRDRLRAIEHERDAELAAADTDER